MDVIHLSVSLEYLWVRRKAKLETDIRNAHVISVK